MATERVWIPVERARLVADLSTPNAPRGLVVFAHGSGSSRLSPRNRHVAAALQRDGLATLLLDLLTVDEEREDALGGRWRFDVAGLATRLLAATEWAAGLGLPVGYFGASTGAAAALIAAAAVPDRVAAVVSRGGRPDLARDALPAVRAPTLLIVGGEDRVVLELNRGALRQLGAPGALEVVPGAGHLFEEAGALDEVARLAGDWFLDHLDAAHSETGEPAGQGRGT